ncbi:MAG: HAMP domain-containing protein [Treponema sp.]|nr:HAMP domain-containing protein [Treponema sp.]
MRQRHIKTSVLFPIGAKLVIIITSLLLASLGAVISIVSALSTQDAQRAAEENNFTINIRAGSQAESSFNGVREAALFYLSLLERLPVLEHDPEMERFFFDNNQNIAAIGVFGGAPPSFIHNTQFLDENGISAAAVEAYMASAYHSATPGATRLFNASPVFHTSMIAAVFAYQSAAGSQTVKALFSPHELFESFSTGANTSFLINNYGDLLLHPDVFLVLGGANFSSLPIVEIMLREGDNNRQVSYEHEGVGFFGAYYRLAGTDAAVITLIPHDIVFEVVQSTTRQNIFLAAAVLFIAISLTWIFSKTISRPARILAAAALKIQEGDFTINLKPQTRDELGLLTESFNKMSSALNIFGRFTNKDVALRAMRGEIKPGGQPKRATIFFSDIRSFTEKTEIFTKRFGDQAPNRVVLWLNEYFSRMIDCVAETSGVVDKFIGDALMAHWGTVSTAGSPAKDAFNCVKAALMMRGALVELNAGRVKNEVDNPVIHIGCGINTGTVIAGQIGSEARMDYTVIGDPVNIASRLEELNKTFGTDILISEDTWKLIGDKFITEEMPVTAVRGKEEPMRVFAVVNFAHAEGPQTLAQVRELLGISACNVVSVPAVPVIPAAPPPVVEEENTYEISIPEHIPEPVRERILEEIVSQDRHSAYTSEKPRADGTNIPVIKMTSFGSSALVLGPDGRRVPVFFSWNRFDPKSLAAHHGRTKAGENALPDVHVIVEVAKDRSFNSTLEDREVIDALSVSIPLNPGIYWWRVYPANPGSRVPIAQPYPCGVLVVDTHEKERIKIHKS